MQIDEAWRDDETGGVEHFDVGRLFLSAFQDTEDAIILNQQISSGVNSLHRIHHITVGN
jgi:hypothetical protein